MTGALEIDLAYPRSGLAVEGANARTLESFKQSGAGVYAELGVYEGDTALAIAEQLGGRGELHLFDYDDTVAAAAARLRAAGHENVVAHGNSRKLLDSYNWSLMELLRERGGPFLEYVFLDGAHTWGVDALAFLLIDRLLVPGGYIEFDDYHWTIARSPSMNPDVFPASARLYTPEQIEQAQVALVVDVIVRPDSRYEELVENRLFRKQAGADG
jgi:predicted O-methyltransferase YrrM